MQTSDYNEQDIFIEGKLVILRLPRVDSDVLNGQWHSWFNDSKITEYLEHGVFPVSKERQAELIASELCNASSLILAIVSRASGQHIGVISIKSINFLQRKGEIAIVMGPNADRGAAIESMALMTEHAFDRLNLQKLYAGQHEGLWKWVNALALIGYKIEGYRENWGICDGRSWGAVITAVEAKEFYNLKNARGGDILNGDPVALQSKRAKLNFVPELKNLLRDLNGQITQRLSN